ncbi:MAG: type II toxin-antitoxin system PemK/MazF family toxin [Kineosporiaceae bacterium]
MAEGLGGQVGRAVLRAITAGATAAARSLLRSPSSRTPTGTARRAPSEPRRTGRAPSPRSRPAPAAPSAPSRPSSGNGYPGDFTGEAVVEYRPDPDGDADPGEVVWGWVPYEEDHGQGKDRPVLVIGKDAGWLLCLTLTSQDHDRDAAQEARQGRQWMDVGAGDWDARGRPSEVRLDRVVRLDPAAVRREGGTLRRDVFDAVADEVRRVNGWG